MKGVLWEITQWCISAVVFILALILLGTVLSIFAGIPSHEWNRHVLDKRFEKEISHPSDSRLIKHFTKVGGFAGGDGSYCNYAVADIRSSLLPRDAIERYYENMSMESLHPGIQDKAWVEVHFPEAPEQRNYTGMPLHDWLWENKDTVGPGTLYLVGIIDYSSADGDIRCD